MNARHILIPTDFSEPSKTALKLANTFIDIYGSKVDLIHVIPLATYFSQSMEQLGLPLDMNEDVYPKILSDSEDKLEALAKEFIKKDHVGKLKVIIDRKPSEAIADYAKENGHDLILMSATGAHETDFFRGSITEKVIRHAKTPVLTVDKEFTKENLNTIMVPVDFSFHSFGAIPVAFELTHQFDATLELFHVNELYAADAGGFVAPTGGLSDEASYKAMKESLKRFFEEEDDRFQIEDGGEDFVDRITRTDGANSVSLPVLTKVIKGISAHHEISEYANENADLLVMTTHGRTGLAHFFLGSTTENVVQHARLPVLTIRPEKLK